MAVLREHRRLQGRSDAAGDHMRIAQIRLREGDQDRAVFLAGGEVDRAGETRDQTCAIERGARIERSVEGEARKRQRLTAIARVRDRLAEIAEEAVAREQA